MTKLFFGNLASGHFSGKNFSRRTPLCPTGSNDTGLKTVAFPGAEFIAGQTDRQTGKQRDIFVYYNT